MESRSTSLWVAAVLLVACGVDSGPGSAPVGGTGTAPASVSESPESSRKIIQEVFLPAAPPPGNRVVSRTIDKDFDADGIADYRLTIRETLDAAGNLVSRSREEDFEADGIVDERVTTWFAE
jgi:hypothetical protein